MICRYFAAAFLVALLVACTPTRVARMAPMAARAERPDLVASIAGCRASESHPPLLVQSAGDLRPGFLVILVTSTRDTNWRGESSAFLLGPLDENPDTASVAMADGRAVFSQVRPGRYVARFRAIGHYARVDTVALPATAASITVPLVMTPSHACGFDGYKVETSRSQPPAT